MRVPKGRVCADTKFPRASKKTNRTNLLSIKVSLVRTVIIQCSELGQTNCKEIAARRVYTFVLSAVTFDRALSVSEIRICYVGSASGELHFSLSVVPAISQSCLLARQHK